jgi:hypothetical protein
MPPILKSSSYSPENLQALIYDKPTISDSSLSISSIVASVLIRAREVREPARVRVTKSTVRQRGVISGLCSEAFWTLDFNDIIIIRLKNWKIWLGHWIAGKRQDVLASLLECGVAKVVLLSLWVHITLSVDLSRGSRNWDMYSDIFLY